MRRRLPLGLAFLLAAAAAAASPSSLLISGVGRGIKATDVLADPRGGWVVTGEIADVASPPAYPAWVASLDEQGALRRAVLIGRTERPLRIHEVTVLSADLIGIAGSLGTQAWIAGLSPPDMTLRWQVALDAPFDCGGRKDCQTFAGIVDVARLDDRRMLLLARAGSAWNERARTWLVMLASDGRVLGQALLDVGRDDGLGLDPAALALAPDGVLVAGTLSSSAWKGGEPCLIVVRPPPEPDGAWQVVRSTRLLIPHGARTHDVAATGVVADGAASHVVMLAPSRPTPTTPECLDLPASRRRTAEEQPVPAAGETPKPSALSRELPLGRFIFGDVSGGVMLVGLKADGSVAWASATCVVMDLAPGAIAFDGAGAGLAACDVASGNRDVIATAVDAKAGPGASRQSWFAWTHEFTLGLAAGPRGFAAAGDASIVDNLEGVARLLELDARGTPPSGCPWTEPDLSWVAARVSASEALDVRVSPTRVAAAPATAGTVDFIPSIQVECAGAPVVPRPPPPVRVSPPAPERTLGR